ncbi:tetratricopeptide repeat protein [Anabaena variabilis FACHB-164]|nr:tetratricopeptide repeat protein [Trichormus variabilis FACHB-164]
MNNQAFYIWLQQCQDLWDQIQHFIVNNKDIFIVSFGTGSLLAIVRFIWWVVQQNRKRKLLPDTFPFEVIKPQSNALQILLGGNENDPLADYKIPYQDRVPGRNTQDELKQKLDQHRWLLILAPTGWGKTREAANLADRLNNEGWTILKLKRGEWLEAPPILPEDKIGTDRKLLFFLDDLNNKMFGGRIEQSPKADDPLQPLNKPLQERLFNTLEAYEKLCRKEDIRIIATARNEKEREFPDEPSEWEKLEFDKYSFWKRFEIYNLPEPNEEAIIGVLRETIHQANIQANPDDYSRIAQRNDRTFRNIVENLRSTKNYDRFLTIDNFRDTLNGTWEERYQKTIKKYPVAIYIYDAVELLQKMGIKLYPFTVEPTAQMMVDGNLLRQIWHWWQIRTTLPYLISVEGILKPRDGQVEAKGKQIEVEQYISKLLNLLLKIAKKYPTEMLTSLFKFGYKADFLRRDKEAIVVWEAALKIKPDLYELWYNKGVALFNLKQYTEAIAAYEAGLKIKPDDHEAWHNKGNTLANLGQYAEAIAAYEEAIKIKSDDHESWNHKGNALANLGRNEEAIAAWDATLKIQPNDYEAWNNKGCMLFNLGRNEEAIAAYDAALNIKPDRDKTWNHKGVALANLERNEEAIAAYDAALNIKPDKDGVWCNKGLALANLGQYAEAITAWDAALNIKPDKDGVWYNKGVTLAKLGNYEEAITAYDAALNIKPDDYKVWNNKAVALTKLGNYVEAIAACDKSLNIKPDQDGVWYCKAGCYAMLENVDQAIYNLQQAIHLNPEEYRELVKSHSVFDNIRNDERFQVLLQE